MKKFLLKSPAEGLIILYLDDSDVEGFKEIARATEAVQLYSSSHVLLYNENGVTLHGIQDNEVFQVNLQKNDPIDFIGGICIFQKNNQWYTPVFKDGCWQEYLLGKKCEIEHFTTANMIVYSRASWEYFVKNTDKGIELCHILKDKPVVLGTSYVLIKETNRPRIAALDKNGYYDIFTPNSYKPREGEQDETFSALNGVFVWCQAKQQWFFHENCQTFGKNAIIKIMGDKYGEKIELFKLNEESITLVESGPWKWITDRRHLILRVNDNTYTLDPTTQRVNLDNPKPTIKKRIRNFFKK